MKSNPRGLAGGYGSGDALRSALGGLGAFLVGASAMPLLPVALASAHLFGTQAGLGGPIALTATFGYGLNAAVLITALAIFRHSRRSDA